VRHRNLVGRALVVSVSLVVLASCSTTQERRETRTTAVLVSTSIPVVETTTSSAEPSPSTTFAPGIANAEAYLFDAIRLVETHAVLADRIDWEARRIEATEVVATATFPSQVHRFVKELLNDLGDNHSQFVAKPDLESPPDDAVVAALPTSELLDDRIGLIVLGPWPMVWEEEVPRYVEAAYEAMRELESEGVCGWIVDLRSNVGGYAPAMFAGVVPFITDHEHDSSDPLLLASTTDAAGDEHAWTYDGKTIELESVDTMELTETHQLADPAAPVAVLIGGTTASAGEMTATIFNGRPDTRVFGFPTAGRLAAVIGVPLEDGAVMIVAAHEFTDRQGNQYDPIERLQPDDVGGDTQPAVDWLLNHDACTHN